MALLNGRKRTTRFLAILLTGAAAWTDVRGQAVDEYQVKAAFLYNFAKFVEWPAASFKGPNDPIAICVFGQSPVKGTLEQAVSGKTIGSRAFIVRQVSEVQAASSCHILFLSSSERKRLRSTLGEIKDGRILTVGETEGFAAEGGIVNFKLDDGKVRIQINVEAAEQAKLQISSKLLSLAQIVRNEK
jgi:hypothetical protein